MFLAIYQMFIGPTITLHGGLTSAAGLGVPVVQDAPHLVIYNLWILL